MTARPDDRVVEPPRGCGCAAPILGGLMLGVLIVIIVRLVQVLT